MKYNINVNQLAIVKSGVDIDIYDAVIIDFLVEFSKSDSIVKINENGIEFYWFSYDKIIDDLPVLKLKKDSVYRRMKRLCDIGLLIQNPDAKKIGRSFFAFTEKIKSVIVTNDIGSKSDTSDSNPKVGRKSEASGKNPNGRNSKRKTSDQNPKDNNINNNKDLFSNENEGEIVPDQKCPIYNDAVKIYFNFFRNRSGGLNPKFDAGDGKALKQMIGYFKTLSKDSPTQKEDVLKTFNVIFKNWDKLDQHLRKQVKMTQINSNINNIINFLKNGQQQSNSKNGSAKPNSKIVGSTRPFSIDDFKSSSEN